MEYGFNIDINPEHFSLTDEVEDFKHPLKSSTIKLKNYLLEDNVSIDAKTVIKHLFPAQRCDIFISHSYQDQDLAIQLALDLKKKGITTFIDSTVWGSVYDLLKAIDEKLSLADRECPPDACIGVEKPGHPHPLRPRHNGHSSCWRNKPELNQRLHFLNLYNPRDIRWCPSRNLLPKNCARAKRHRRHRIEYSNSFVLKAINVV